MQNDRFISIQEVSDFCHVELTILRDFADYGLIHIQVQGNTEYIVSDEILRIRGIIELYRGLGINKEGIEVILSMRDQILEMHNEIARLRQHIDQLDNEQKFRFLELPSMRGLMIDYDE